jgi:hypothetical protein
MIHACTLPPPESNKRVILLPGEPIVDGLGFADDQSYDAIAAEISITAVRSRSITCLTLILVG